VAKAIHMMIRALDEQRSLDFYGRAFGLGIAQRVDFEDFSLIYLANPESESSWS
jgi:lactoylglutathione lyase